MEDLYPSRINSEPTVIERNDPILHSDAGQLSPGPLTIEQLKSFDSNGFLFLPNLFSDQEVKNMQSELDGLWEEASSSTRPEVIREPQSDKVRSIFAVHRDDPMFSALARDSRLQSAVEQILGSEVYVHQSRINYKQGFNGKEFYWHSDFETWHVEDGMPRMRAVSFSILLDDNYEYNGPLMLIPGSHKYFVSCVGRTPENHYKDSLRKQEYGVPDHESLTWLAKQGGISVPTGPAGSVLMFECNTMHGSNSNITPFSRRNVFMVYNSVSNALVKPFSGQAPRPEYIATRQSSLVNK